MRLRENMQPLAISKPCSERFHEGSIAVYQTAVLYKSCPNLMAELSLSSMDIFKLKMFIDKFSY